MKSMELQLQDLPTNKQTEKQVNAINLHLIWVTAQVICSSTVAVVLYIKAYIAYLPLILTWTSLNLKPNKLYLVWSLSISLKTM